MHLFGIKLVGVNAETGQKLLLTISLIVVLYVIARVVTAVIRGATHGGEKPRWAFWVRQVMRLFIFVVATLGIVSIWLDQPATLTTAFGLVTAGLAFALQQVITSFAAYFVILFAKNYTVGQRIVMGGVRGDVISIGFLQTTIMEMGQPPASSGGDPDVWVRSRQYTGRVVSVSNGKIFDDPVYNYSRDFSYIWEAIHLPITYDADRARAEQILLDAARDHTLDISRMSEEALKEMQERYFVAMTDMKPRVFYRLTDNWLELSLRFVVEERGIRDIKDKMSRQIIDQLDAAGIGLASATYDIVGMPPLRIVDARGDSDESP